MLSVVKPRAPATHMNFSYSHRRKYRGPESSLTLSLSLRSVLEKSERAPLGDRQYSLLAQDKTPHDATIFAVGDVSLLSTPSVAIVGTREVSEDGRRRAFRLARELSNAGVTVVSGLARGVDTAAHTSAIESGGRTIAVIGTPLSKAYPAENADLQQLIYSQHLLVSPFAEGEATFKSNFPKRNRVMAAISDATVIIEASDTSGTLHQAAECQRLGRWLFIAQSVACDESLTWPARFLGKEKVGVLRSVQDILDAVEKH